MAWPWSRKGRARGPDHTAPDRGGDVHLDAAEHAWWAQRDAGDLLSQSNHPEVEDRRERAEREPERDILAEHFGADWRTSFGFDSTGDVPLYQPPPDERPPEEPAEDLAEIDTSEIDTTDPYSVLDVDPSASWEDIVNAHRRQARQHHPDRLGGQPEAIIAAAEDRIRYINIAYQELRVRRGK